MTWGDIILLSFISGILILEVTPSNFLLYIGILLIIILLIVILIPINTYNKKIYIIIIVCCGTIYNFSYKETITPKYYKNEYREYIKECIIKKYPEQEHHSILLALLIGDKSNIPKELKKSYSNAGVTHLMAVSGLHIGIIYAIINSFLFILNLSYNNKLIKHFIVAIILVIFCYITGFTPSVLRATIMIISYNFINYFCHAKNKYSPLLFSAFIIFLINPSTIHKIAFMLSFAAMAGILFIYSTISQSFISNKKNKCVLNYINRLYS